jgi:uncharacterized protein (DUF433 family)
MRLACGMRYRYNIKRSNSMNKSISIDSSISKTNDVCGGSACIRSTRIPVWSLVSWQRLGKTDEQLLEMYPSLLQHDLDAAWHYYALNQVEIDQDITSNDEA